MAKRYESFCKGVTFSARPVKINERVVVRFSEISANWSGVIRFGFTYNDPATLRNNLPKYACPDLTNKPGYWAKALNERFCERENILFYYVTSAGDVHFGINGEEKGVFITGIETRHPLWTLIDCYGNCSAIEFLDPRIATQRQRTMSAEQEIDRIIPSMQTVTLNEYPAPIVHRPTIAYGNAYQPVPFHRIKGRNVMLSSDKLIATRAESEYCQGYVFTARPIAIGEKLIVQILRTDNMYVGALALGLTSCDPASLQAGDLPGDSDLLLDRPEYWVVTKDVAANLNRGDEITFSVTANGEVQISKNNGPPSVVMHVDQSLQLWAFLDVYGSTQSVRVFSHVMASTPSYNQLAVPNCNNSANALMAQRQADRRRTIQLPSSESLNSISSQSLYRAEMQSQQRLPLPCHVLPPPPPMPLAQQATPSTSSGSTSSGSASSSACVINNDMIQLQPGGTVLVVNLPPATTSDVSSVKSAGPRITQVPLNAAHSNQSSTMVSFNFIAIFGNFNTFFIRQTTTKYILEIKQLLNPTVFLSSTYSRSKHRHHNNTARWPAHNGRMASMPTMSPVPNAPFATRIPSIRCYIRAVTCACATNVR